MRILIVEDEKKVAKALRDGLEQTFGSEYEAFRAAVPRWIPPDDHDNGKKQVAGAGAGACRLGPCPLVLCNSSSCNTNRVAAWWYRWGYAKAW